MIEPTACDRARPSSRPCYCDRCDLLVGLDGFHVLDVSELAGKDPRLRVVVESPRVPMGCHGCGVIASSRGRRDVRLIDVPCFGRPVDLVWRKRTWRCHEPLCTTKSFTERDDNLAPPRALLSRRACWWAIGQLRREHASIAGLARQLGTTWNTVWSAIKPLLETMAEDDTRFDGVDDLGVDEHVWHHVDTRPPELGGRGRKSSRGW